MENDLAGKVIDFLTSDRLKNSGDWESCYKKDIDQFLIWLNNEEVPILDIEINFNLGTLLMLGGFKLRMPCHEEGHIEMWGPPTMDGILRIGAMVWIKPDGTQTTNVPSCKAEDTFFLIEQ